MTAHGAVDPVERPAGDLDWQQRLYRAALGRLSGLLPVELCGTQRIALRRLSSSRPRWPDRPWHEEGRGPRGSPPFSVSGSVSFR
jgi:hypothetical protein